MGLHFNCQKAPFNGAPDVKVEGIILDEGGDSLPFANIYLTSNTDMGTSSDFNGEFELTVPMGSNISISFMGYETQTITADRTFKKVIMQTSEEALDPVVIVAEKKKPFPWWLLLIPVGLWVSNSSEKKKTVKAKI